MDDLTLLEIINTNHRPKSNVNEDLKKESNFYTSISAYIATNKNSIAAANNPVCNKLDAFKVSVCL